MNLLAILLPLVPVLATLGLATIILRVAAQIAAPHTRWTCGIAITLGACALMLPQHFGIHLPFFTPPDAEATPRSIIMDTLTSGYLAAFSLGLALHANHLHPRRRSPMAWLLALVAAAVCTLCIGFEILLLLAA